MEVKADLAGADSRTRHSGRNRSSFDYGGKNAAFAQEKTIYASSFRYTPLAAGDGGFLVGLDGEGGGVDLLIVTNVEVGGGLLVVGWGEELLLERDATLNIHPDDDVGEEVTHGLLFRDQVELDGFDRA